MVKVEKCLYCEGEILKFVTSRSDGMGIIRCNTCNVMMVEYLSDNTENLYTSDYFEKPSDTKSGYTNYLSSPIVNLIGKFGFTMLFARDAKSHLDLGCADGSLIEIFKDNDINSSGLEISKDAVSIARSKGLDVNFSTLHEFPQKTKRNDVITAFDLLEHADKPGNVLREVFKNLNPNGYFVFSTLSVKKLDASDYWLSHSFEHYVYYDRESLQYILTEVFGEDNFGFTEVEINGISEFWGFAKKGKINRERVILEMIENSDYSKEDPELAYLTSLFYDQISRFSKSREIINHFVDEWSQETRLTASFYNYFYQGQYEKALLEFDNNAVNVRVNNGTFWQALSFTRAQFYQILKLDIEKLHDSKMETLSTEISDLHEKVIALESEINISSNKMLAKRRFSKSTVGKYLPKSVKKKIKDRLAEKDQNILITIPWMTFGGAETLIYNFTKELKKNHKIVFVTGLQSANEWEHKFRDVSNDIYHLPELGIAEDKYVDKLCEIIKSHRIGVLHIIHNGFTFSMLPQIKQRFPDLRVVLTLFNDRVPDYVTGAIDFQEYIDVYTTDNQAVVDSIGKRLAGSTKPILIPNGIDTIDTFNIGNYDRNKERSELDIEETDIAIFFLGRLSPEKNPNVFVETARKFNINKYRNIKFFVVGDGPMMEQIANDVSGLTNIRILGYKEDVPKYLSCADIMILPSSIEGFPLSMLEAMSMEVAVIASRVGAVPDVIVNGENGFIVDPGNVSQIVKCIKKLHDNAELFSGIRKNSRICVESTYTSAKVASKYESAYKGTVV